MNSVSVFDEKKPEGVECRKFDTKGNGIRWSTMENLWHGEPWSFAKWRLSKLKAGSARIKFQPVIEAKHGGCLNCPPRPQTLPLTAWLAVGFGSVSVHAGGVCIWSGDNPNYRMARVEALYQTRPNLDWIVAYDAPLKASKYQRQPAGWVLIEQGPGFA